VLEIGAVIGDYRLEERIGRGGMGVVFRATQLSLGRSVAVKLITPELADDPAYRERFKREARLAARIAHPNVVPVHQAEEHEGHLFIAMHYVPGSDLRSFLKERGRLEPGEAVRIVEQVAAALDAAHELGLVHRDVKPGNVLLSGKKGEHVYLTDFGLTKNISSTADITRTGAFVGTLDYIAPEQLRAARVDGRADVYALGCVLFQLLTGAVPFKRDSDPAKLYAHMSEPPPRASETDPTLPAGFDGVIQRSMAKSPDERYPTAGEMAAAARGVIAGEPASGAPTAQPDEPGQTAVLPSTPSPGAPAETAVQPSPTPPPARSSSLSSRRLGALGAICVAGASAAVIAVTASDSPRTTTPSTPPAPVRPPSLVVLSPDEVVAKASSTLKPQGVEMYAARNTTDGDSGTTWSEGRPGSGRGASITWTFKRTVDLRRATVVNGYARNRELFDKNSRIRTAVVTTAQGSRSTTLRDARAKQRLAFASGPTTFMRLTIGTVYEGRRFDDTCLSDVEFQAAGS